MKFWGVLVEKVKPLKKLFTLVCKESLFLIHKR